MAGNYSCFSFVQSDTMQVSFQIYNLLLLEKPGSKSGFRVALHVRKN